MAGTTIRGPLSAAYRPALLTALLITVLWFLPDRGCVLSPAVELTPLPVLAAAAPRYPVGPPTGRSDDQHNSAIQAPPQSSGDAVQSLNRAANLLNQAADALDKNEHLAVELIRRAIAILKHEVIRGIKAPDFERVSMDSAFLRDETFE